MELQVWDETFDDGDDDELQTDGEPDTLSTDASTLSSKMSSKRGFDEVDPEAAVEPTSERDSSPSKSHIIIRLIEADHHENRTCEDSITGSVSTEDAHSPSIVPRISWQPRLCPDWSPGSAARPSFHPQHFLTHAVFKV